MEIFGATLNPSPTDGFLTVIVDGKQHTIHASSPNFANAVSAYVAKDFETMMNAIEPSRKFASLYAKYEQIEVKDGSVFVSGEAVTSIVADRIITYLADGIDCLPIFKFITRLQNNPSKRAVDELYTFLEHKFLPLTETGTFLAYKAVRNNFTDKHTGRYLNEVGAVLEMPRNKVDDDKEIGCSYGFHAGTLDYASNFACGDDKLVLVEIDPADVVSIPTDCNFQKLRTCRYKVVSEFERPLTEHVYESRFSTEYDEDIDEEWDADRCDECGYNICDCDCDRCNGCECISPDLDENGYCSECSDDDSDDEELEDAYEPKTEVQLTLNLDNKPQIHWGDVKVSVNALLNHLFKSRRIAIALAFRRDNNELGYTDVPFNSLLNYTSEENAYNVYKEMTQ